MGKKISQEEAKIRTKNVGGILIGVYKNSTTHATFQWCQKVIQYYKQKKLSNIIPFDYKLIDTIRNTKNRN